MKRWWVTFALLLSVGFNLGLLAAVAGGWWAARGAAVPATAPAEVLPSQVEVVAVGENAAGEIGVPLAGGVRVEPPPADSTPAPPASPGEEPVRVAQAAPSESEPPPPPASDEPAPEDDEGSLGDRERPAGARPGLERQGFERPGFEPQGLERQGFEQQGPPLERLADHLGLEGETRRRFVEVQRRLFEAQVESRLRRGRLGRELRRELLAAEPDRERIERLIEQMGETFVAAEKATAGAILETRLLLTPEQQRRYLHVLERLRGGGGPGGPGEGPRGRPGQRRRPGPGAGRP